MIEIAPLEDDEYVICINGRPVGQSVFRRDAIIIERWLKTAEKDIDAALNNHPSPDARPDA